MTATLTSQPPAAPPPSAGLEAPPVVERSSRWRWWVVLAILVVWYVGFLVFYGQWTLALSGPAQLTPFFEWLNHIRDLLLKASIDGGGAFTVINVLSDAINWVVQHLQYVFSQPAPGRPVPIIGWLGVVGIGAYVAYFVAGLRMALVTIGSLLLCGFLGYYTESMDTLVFIAVSVAMCVVIGLPLGIWMSRSKAVSAVVTPVLDIMQTMPSFAYLAPLALVFGIGNPAAVMVTFIYAFPPIVRISAHGLRTVSPTTVEATRALGSSSGQLLRYVQLPMARRTIIVGLNQTILAALSMVVIAVFVGAPGLGVPVIQSLAALNMGTAFVSGLCIVILAIWLDRLTTAASERSEVAARKLKPAASRRLGLIGGAIAAVVAVALSNQWLQFSQFPTTPDLGTAVGDGTTHVINWITSFGAFTTKLSDFVTTNLINPLTSLLTHTPWFITLGAFLALSLVLGGWKALLSTAICGGIIVATGLWSDAMVTLATTLVAVVLVMVLAFVIGVWMGRSTRVDAVVRPILDFLQVMPALVYLIPAVALFGVGTFPAMIAAIAYGAPVAIKIMADGIRNVAPTTVEAARSLGTGRWQMITKVQVPMARSSAILAANQGILFVLAVVVLGGLIGGGGLGFLVVDGFSQDSIFGKGLAAGIAITALGVMLDRVMRYSAERVGRSEA